MKKMLTILTCGLLFMTGCTEQQKKSVSKTSGIVAATTWRSIDNPDTNELAQMRYVVQYIQSNLSTNKVDSYYNELYPKVTKVINTSIDSNQRPLCLLGASFILSSIDTLFAMHPEWKEDTNSVKDILSSFCDGVYVGLSYSNTDPVMQAAFKQNAVRVQMNRSK